MHLVSFGGPIVQHSCAMNTQSMQHSCFVLHIHATGGTLAIIMDSCVCAREGVELWLYSWTLVFGPESV